MCTILDGGSLSSLPHSALVGPASSPMVGSGEPVSVPDNLLKICKAKPVIFKGKKNNTPKHSTRPYVFIYKRCKDKSYCQILLNLSLVKYLLLKLFNSHTQKYEINVICTNIVHFTGHGNFPYLCGNINDVIVSPLLYTCYRNSQSLSRAYEQYGASTIQPISEEMQLLLTVYYLVQLGKIIF